MQGKPTVHYFQLYGRAEPVRMALWKAGVDYTDNAITGPDWMTLKESGKLPFGQMPALELADGTFLAQGGSCLNYVGDLYPQLKSADPLVNAKADSIASYTGNDVIPKIGPKIFSSSENQEAELKVVVDEWMPKWFAKLVEFLPADKKFLTGDSVSIYDFAVAGIFTNLICNPKSKNPAVWAATWEKAPERVKKYVADFNEDMKGYLDARPKDYSM